MAWLGSGVGRPAPAEGAPSCEFWRLQAFQPLHVSPNGLGKSAHISLSQVLRKQRRQAGLQINSGLRLILPQEVRMARHKRQCLIGRMLDKDRDQLLKRALGQWAAVLLYYVETRPQGQECEPPTYSYVDNGDAPIGAILCSGDVGGIGQVQPLVEGTSEIVGEINFAS